MPITTKTYEQFVSDQVTGFAGLLKISPSLKSGNVILALYQAATLGALLYLQSLAQQVYKAALGCTATGPDLDTWWSQFGFVRKPAAYASGTATVGINQTSSVNIIVRPGMVIQTVGGGIQYQVIADTTQPAWSTLQNAYVLPAGQLSINVTIQANLPGSASNVQAGQLIQFGGSSAGLNSVTNSAPILTGSDAETDAAGQQRFILAFNSVNADSTLASVLSAALGVQGVVDVTVVENIDENGNPLQGSFLVIVDDGTGAPSSTLLNNVFARVNAVRACGIECRVSAPALTTVSVSVTIRIASGASQSQVTLNVLNAVLDLINTLEISSILYSSQIEKAIMNADPNVVAIQPGSLVCAQADQTPAFNTVYRSSNTHVTIGTY